MRLNRPRELRVRIVLTEARTCYSLRLSGLYIYRASVDPHTSLANLDCVYIYATLGVYRARFSACLSRFSCSLPLLFAHRLSLIERSLYKSAASHAANLVPARRPLTLEQFDLLDKRGREREREEEDEEREERQLVHSLSNKAVSRADCLI